MSAAKKRKAGRPPAGIDGAPSSEYPQLGVRVAQETIEQIAALAASLDIPRWQVVSNAIDAYSRRAGRRKRQAAGYSGSEAHT